MKSTPTRITLIFILLVLFFPNLIFAEIKTFVKEYTYQASEFDSKASSRTIALEQVKRLLLEELGSYLESKTEVKNFELSKDKITALSAGIVQTQIIDEKWDGKNYWLKALIKADPENVAKSIDTLRKDQRKVTELEEKIKQHDKALKEIDSIRSEMISLKNDIEAQNKFNKSINILNKDEKTSTADLTLVSYIPPDFQKTLEMSASSKATSWTWRPGKSVICIVEFIKAVNGMPFLQMATIMLSKNTYANLDSNNYNEYNGRVFFTQLELTGYDNAGNIHYKQHQSNFDLAQMPIYEKMPIIRDFWKGSNEKSIFENSEIALALIQLESFSKKRGENNNYICPIGTEFKLNNFLFHNIAFKLNRIGNTSEFTPSFVSIEIMATMKGE